MYSDSYQNWLLKRLEAIGAHTLSIYVVHRAILEFISLFCIVNFHIVPSSILHLILIVYPILSTFICVNVSLWIESFSKKYFENVLFEKPNVLTFKKKGNVH